MPHAQYNGTVNYDKTNNMGEITMKGFTDYVLAPLTFIGAINWGLIGIFGFDLVAWLFGPATMVSNIVYAIIGVAAVIWLIWMFIARPIR